jgi:predicted sugar kinase
MTFHIAITANENVATRLKISGSAPIKAFRGRVYGMTGVTLKSMRIRIEGKLVEDETATIADLVHPNVRIKVKRIT